MNINLFHHSKQNEQIKKREEEKSKIQKELKKKQELEKAKLEEEKKVCIA